MATNTVLQVVQNYSGSSAAPAADGSLQVDGQKLTCMSAVCRHIARESPKADVLLGGGNSGIEAQVSEWMTWASTELSPVMDDKLVKINEHLATRSFLVGNSVTLADLVVFALVQPAVVNFPAAQHDHFTHLRRWCDLMQNTADAGRVMPRFPLPLPLFNPPAAIAPVPKEKAPTASKDSSASSATPAPVKSAESKDAKSEKKADKATTATAESKPAVAAAPADGAPKKEDKKAKKEEKKAKEDKKEAPAAAAGGDDVRIDMLDIRVGRIVKIDKHPNAEALYLEEIDLGEEKPRQVISGLVKFVPKDKMEGRRVLVVCNLKPAKMREIMSYGMVLCSSNDTHDQVDPVIIPEDVPIGERVYVEGFTNAPMEEVNPKKKILERLFPDMKTDANGVPGYKGLPFMTSKGPLSSTIPNGNVA